MRYWCCTSSQLNPQEVPMAVMATANQVAFISKLVCERAELYRQIGSENSAAAIETYVSTHDLSRLTLSDASTAISKMIATNKAIRQEHGVRAGGVPRITEDGMYRLDDTTYKVQEARNGSGRLYAKRLVMVPLGDGKFKGTFEYAPGMVNKLTDANRMSLDEAKAFGHLYGTCCMCGRTLTDENSISMGIGPICAGKF